ncbi:MAG: AraC family transcriptional regulator [Alphaproteobacteria bacterium]|nr:AraC family transcriptional regulator [Alphaproteobacteria bacterium]
MSDQNAREIVFYTPGKRADAHPYRVIAAGRNQVDRDDARVTTRYHHHTLILTLSGQGQIEMNDRRFEAKPGTVTWLDTAQDYAHGCHPEHRQWRYLWFGMQGFGLDGLFERLEAQGNPVAMRHASIQGLFEIMIANLLRKDRMTDANSTQLAARIIALILEFAAVDQPAPDQADPIRTAMQAFLEDRSVAWTVEEFASRAHQSVSHFHRRFKAVTGVSPMKWMRQERINAAKYLLSTTNEKIARIGKRCGYPDPYHFSRTFTRLTGVTPSQFRRTGSL